MNRYAAFLRGVNLGRRQVKSAELRAVFEALGFGNVKTLLASGNVLFDAEGHAGLQGRIEAGLKQQFGFEVAVVLRSFDELTAMIASKPFGDVDPGAEVALHVLLCAEPMGPLSELKGVEGDYDVARVDPREIYFIVHKKPDGTFLGRSAIGDIDKDLPKGALVTMRNWNTILKAAA